MQYYRYLAATLCLLCSFSVLASSVKIQSYAEDTSLPHKLLVETLSRAGLSHSYSYSNDKNVSNARILNDVKNGELDIMWSMTSRELERDYQAIYIPLYRGLLGMRLAIVKRERLDLFNSVATLSKLKAFTAGQGKTWPDTKILEHNGLTVAKTLKYPNLFYMLEGERFDYFPRGIFEPWDEIKRHSDLKLAVEPNLIIKYRAPLYYFVNKNNAQLFQSLTQALNQMVKDGTFERMFFSDEQVSASLQQANVSNRIIIELDNPFLTEQTPLDRPELWFDPMTYQGN